MLRIRNVYPGSRIRIFHPGYRIKKIPAPGSGPASKILSIFYPKKLFLSSRKYDPGCSSRIRIRNTAREYVFLSWNKKGSYYLDMVLRCGLHGPREVGVDTPPVRVQVAAIGEILEIEYENLLWHRSWQIMVWILIRTGPVFRNRLDTNADSA